MDLINKRYRVIHQIDTHYHIKAYVVKDLLLQQTAYLYMIDEEKISNNLIHYLFKNYTRYKNLNIKGVLNVLDFGAVLHIDNKRVETKLYYFVTEWIAADGLFSEVVQSLSNDEKLEVFCELCKAVNNLFLKGYVYGLINENHILMYKEKNGKWCIYLKDIMSLEIEKKQFYIQTDFNKNVNFRELSSIFYELFLINKSQDLHFEKLAFEIYSKLNSDNSTEIYESITHCIQDINVLFGKQYAAFDYEELEKINLEIPLTGREYELNKILEKYQEVLAKKSKIHIVGLHGDSGIGKSRLLNEIKEYIKFYHSNNKIYTLENDQDILDVFNKVVKDSPPQLEMKYKEDLNRFFENVDEIKELNSDIENDKDILRMINRLVTYICEYCKNKPSVFLFDDLHKYGDFLIKFVEYLCFYTTNTENVMIILAYEENEQNDFFVRLIKKLEKLEYFSQHKLSPLMEAETMQMIMDMLCSSTKLVEFTHIIFSETQGTPLFTVEVVRDLFIRKLIYIGDWGTWSSDYDSKAIPIPIKLEKTMENQMYSIDSVRYQILEILSLFDKAIDIPLFTELLKEDKIQFINHYHQLKSDGYVSEKISDRGLLVDFKNRMLKRMIYKKSLESFKQQKHRMFAERLETLYQLGNTIYGDELIYQLENSQQPEKVIEYCSKKAQNYVEQYQLQTAIKYLEKAAYNTNNPSQLLQLYIQIGDIYTNKTEYIKCEEYYQKALQLAEQLKDRNRQIDILLSIGENYAVQVEVEALENIISEISELLTYTQYDKAEVMLMLLQGYKYIIKQQPEESLAILLKILERCDGQQETLKGSIHSAIASAYYSLGNIEESLKNLEISLVYAQRTNNIRLRLICLNNMGTAYFHFYQDDKKALEYFLETKKISEKYGILANEVLSKINIASIYIAKREYIEAEKLLLESLEQAQEGSQLNNKLDIYFLLGKLYLQIYDFKNAFKYLPLAICIFEEYPHQAGDTAEYYYIMALMHFYLNDLENAERLLEDALLSLEKRDYTIKWEVQILYYIVKLQQCEMEKETEAYIHNFIEAVSKYKSDNIKIYDYYKVVLRLQNKGWVQKAYTVFQCCPSSLHHESSSLYYRYLQSFFDQEDMKLVRLIECYDIAVKKQYKLPLVHICIDLGDLFISKENKVEALNYYLEALSILEIISADIPTDYRLHFVQSVGVLELYKKIYPIASAYKKTEKIQFRSIEQITSLLEIKKTFQEINSKHLISNKAFFTEAENYYEEKYHNYLRNVEQVIDNFKSDSIKNIEFILKYICRIVLAEKGFIVLEDQKFLEKVIANYNTSSDEIEKILSHVKVMAAQANLMLNHEGSHLPKEIKALIKMPIFSRGSSGKSNKPQIVGYVVLFSKKMIHNLNFLSLKQIVRVEPLLSYSLGSYQLLMDATRDKLTGAYNRRYLEEVLSQFIEDARNDEKSFSIIMLDIDNFKGINDVYGHHDGDKVLKKMSQIIFNNIREADIYGRYGGEEFIIVLPDCDDNKAFSTAERLRTVIQKAKLLGNKREVTVSMGVANFPIHGQTYSRLIKRADQALYVAKELGRNRCELWKEGFSGRVKTYDRLTGIISGNISRDFRRVSIMMDMIEIVKRPVELNKKVYDLLGRIIEITEAHQGTLFLVENDSIKKEWSRQRYDQGWLQDIEYKVDTIQTVIAEKKGHYRIEWNHIAKYDEKTGMPDWKSEAVIPLINNGEIKGVLYFTVSITEKEFTYEEYNFMEALGQIAVAML